MNRRPLRIVALADSLSLPRIEGEERVIWDDTWPYRLQQMLTATETATETTMEVINCGRRARLVETINDHDFLEHIAWKRPDIVILQVGVVDCAPRIFSKKQHALLNLPVVPPAVRNRIIKWGSANRRKLIGSQPLAKVYTPPERFRGELDTFGKKVSNHDETVRLLVLPIVIDWDRAEAKSPGYGANVNAYNQILKQFCEVRHATWVELPRLTMATEDVSAYFCSDGYHLNAEGHQLVATAVGAVLAQQGAVRSESVASLV